MYSDISPASLFSLLVGDQKDPDVDALAELATALTGMPWAMVSVLDGPLRWSKAEQGMSFSPEPRELSFCSACVELDDVLVVEDAREDSRFASLPAVMGPAGLRFYAGVPVRIKAGTLEVDATICVMGDQPGYLSEEQLKNLYLLGQLLNSLLASRLALAADHLADIWSRRALESRMAR